MWRARLAASSNSLIVLHTHAAGRQAGRQAGTESEHTQAHGRQAGRYGQADTGRYRQIQAGRQIQVDTGSYRQAGRYK